MTARQYREILIGLDRSLFVMHESHRDMSMDDHRLQQQIAIIRSQVLRAESRCLRHSRVDAAPPGTPESSPP